MRKSKAKTFGMISLFVLGVIAITFLFTVLMQMKSGISPSETDFTFSVMKIYRDIRHSFEVDETNRTVYIGFILGYGILIFVLFTNHNLDLNRYNKSTGKFGPQRVENGDHGNARLLQGGRSISSVLHLWITSNRPKNVGLVYGMHKTLFGKEKIWTVGDDIHNLVIGATRSGKSRKLILPTIWAKGQTGESMVITDPKGELKIYTADYLKSKGYEIVLLNLRDTNISNTFNPMERVNIQVRKHDAIKAKGDVENYDKATDHMARAMKHADEVAHALVVQEMKGSKPNDSFWVDMAKAVIASVILYVAIEAPNEKVKNLRTVRYIIGEYGAPDEDDHIKLYAMMQNLPDDHPAKMVWITVNLAEGRTRVGIFSQAMKILQIFAYPNVSKVTCIQDHNLDDIVKKPTAVFLVVPDESPIYNVLATLYVDQLYQNTVELANQTGNRAERNVNFLLDEFGNMPKIPDFEKKLTIAGGRGLLFSLLVQDIQQIEAIYGKGQNTIMGNCHTWVYLKSADVKTADTISKKLGNYTILKENQGSSMSGAMMLKTQSTSSVNYTTAAKKILDVEQVLRWDVDADGVLVMQIGKYSCVVPAPDLSKYQANKDFGLGDINHNIRTIMERTARESMNKKNNVITELWDGGMGEQIIDYNYDDYDLEFKVDIRDAVDRFY